MKCPICESKLEEKTVSPCQLCGGEETDSKRERHYICEVFEIELVLCDFCYADFDSFYSDFFGLASDYPEGYVQKLGAEILSNAASEKPFCSNCGYQLGFLQFLKKVRDDPAI